LRWKWMRSDESDEQTAEEGFYLCISRWVPDDSLYTSKTETLQANT
jgi:hypothetical protein